MIQDEDVIIWCEIQIGNTEYTHLIEKYIDTILELKPQGKIIKESVTIIYLNAELSAIGINKTHITYEELSIKTDKSGGGYQNIGCY